MKKLSILITALLIALTSAAQINDKSQLPNINKEERFITFDENGEVFTDSEDNQKLSKVSELIGGDVVIVCANCETYDGFLVDLYKASPFSDNCIILSIDNVNNTYYITSTGDISKIEDDIDASFAAALEYVNDPGNPDITVFDAFIDAVKENYLLEGSPSTEGRKSAAVDLPDDNWSKYTIGNRTEQNPLETELMRC